MTQEQKAKAYDNILFTAKGICDNPHASEDKKELLKGLIPELSESEDERIRKGMIRFLESEQAEGIFTYEARQSWIAYLEKQKETHIPWYDYKESKEAGYTIVPNDEYELLIQKEQKPTELEELKKLKDMTHEVKEAYKRGIEVGKTEQKPAEWSEDDKRIFQHCLVILHDYGYDDWLKNNVFPQKREWSEEDNRYITGIISILEAWERAYGLTGGIESLVPKYVTWLNSIRPQPWQKLREYDEKMIECIIMDYEGELEGLTDSPVDSEVAKVYKERIAWLKSLRPQPKEEREPMEIKYCGKIYKVYGVRALPGGLTGYIIEDEPGHYDCAINPEEVLGGGYGAKQNGSPYPNREATFDSPHWRPSEEQISILGKVFARCELNITERDSMVDLFYNLKQMI